MKNSYRRKTPMVDDGCLFQLLSVVGGGKVTEAMNDWRRRQRRRRNGSAIAAICERVAICDLRFAICDMLCWRETKRRGIA